MACARLSTRRACGRPTPLRFGHLRSDAQRLRAVLCCDATLVSPLTRTGQPQPCTADVDGAALRTAERGKAATYPEFQGFVVWPCSDGEIPSVCRWRTRDAGRGTRCFRVASDAPLLAGKSSSFRGTGVNPFVPPWSHYKADVNRSRVLSEPWCGMVWYGMGSWYGLRIEC